MHEKFRRCVVELLGRHRLDDTQIICQPVEIGNCVRHPRPALAKLLESAGCSHQFRATAGERKALALVELVRAVLIVAFDQFRLVVPQVEVWGRTGEVDIDDPLRFAFKV